MTKFGSCLLVFSFVLLASCKDIFSLNNTKDPIMVKVGDRKLFKSQVDGLIHEGTSKADSAAIVDGYLQNWIRENLMIIEAEQNVATDINLNKLVDDYRSSLLVYNYEKKIIDTQLDTTVVYAEKLEYYNANKNQYRLSQPIMKCIIAKIPSKMAGIKNIKPALEKKDLTEAMFLIREKATFHQLDTSTWMTIQDVLSMIPNNMADNDDFEPRKILTGKEKDSEYFVKIIKYYDTNEIPPFDYIESKIEKVILSDRKIQLLKKIRDMIYDKGISEKSFEIFKVKSN